MLALVALSLSGYHATSTVTPTRRRSRPVATAELSSSSVALLDLDGVLCDSEEELTRSAWRTASELWPDVVAAAASLDPARNHGGARRAWVGGDWSKLEGSGEDGLPNCAAAAGLDASQDLCPCALSPPRPVVADAERLTRRGGRTSRLRRATTQDARAPSDGADGLRVAAAASAVCG